MSTTTEAPGRPTIDLNASEAETAFMDALTALNEAAAALTRTNLDEVGLAGLAHGIQQITALRSDMSRHLDAVVNAAAQQPHEKETIIPGVGVLAFHYKTTRTTWDSDAILKEVTQAACVDEKTGQVSDEPDAGRLLGLLTECARLEWRATPLKNHLCMNLDDVREQSKGALTARII